MQAESLPPVPKKLREMLAEYPGLIERLQGVLVRSAERSRRVPLSPFEDAVSMLEGGLEKFAAEAREELKAAESDCDESLIKLATDKEKLMSIAKQKRHWITDEGLFNYFEAERIQALLLQDAGKGLDDVLAGRAMDARSTLATIKRGREEACVESSRLGRAKPPRD